MPSVIWLGIQPNPTDSDTLQSTRQIIRAQKAAISQMKTARGQNFRDRLGIPSESILDILQELGHCCVDGVAARPVRRQCLIYSQSDYLVVLTPRIAIDEADRRDFEL